MVRNNTVSRRTFVKGTGGAAVVGALSGCLGDDETDPDDPTPGEADDDDQYILFGVESEPRTLDPIRVLTSQDVHMMGNVFNFILEIGEDMLFQPDLATSMPEIERDGARWIVEIEPDARWHDGEPVTLEDIRYTVTQPIVEDRGSRADFEMIDEMTDIDEHTIQFDLDGPWSQFDDSLHQPVVPKHVREEHKDADDEWSTNIIGSGPYKFVEWQMGTGVTLERWDDYWGDEIPAIREVEINEFEETSTRITTLQTGESDVIEVPFDGDIFETVDAIDHASLLTAEGMRTNFIAFNCIDGPTADPLVREGIDYCIDLDREIELLFGDAAKRHYYPVPEIVAEEWDFPTERWADIPHEQDFDKARELFEEGGLDPDYELKILSSRPEREEEAVSIANAIEEAGYTASAIRLEWGTFISTFNTGDADDMNLYLLGRDAHPDPHPYIFRMYHESREGVDNGHYFQHDEMHDWIVEAAQTVDFDRRRELYIDIIDTVLEERVHLLSNSPLEGWGVADYVQNLEVNPVSPAENTRIKNNDRIIEVDRP